MLKNELTTVVFQSQLDYLLLESPDAFQAIDSLAMQYLVLSGSHQTLYTESSMDKYLCEGTSTVESSIDSQIRS